MSSSTDSPPASGTVFKACVEPHQGGKDVDWLYAQMAQFNATASGGLDHKPLAVFLRDEHGLPHGGLLGWTLWSWLHIDTLWISDSLRGRGLGQKLLFTAEKAARIRGCTLAEVDTFNFQARAFYEKCGYSVFGTLPGIGRGRFERYYLQKELLT